MRTYLLLLALGCFLSGGVRSEPPKKPPVIEKITENVYRIGAALVDTEARSITCPGVVNMDSGAIEYLAVAPGGKTHESLFRVDVRPMHLQVGLLLMGLEPKNVLKFQGEKKTPEGDPVEIWVRWRDKNGEMQEVQAGEWVQEGVKGKPLPTRAWVFTGSRILKEGFEADIAKSLVALWHDPAAMVDNRTPGGANNAYLVNEKRVPKRGTRIEFVIKAVPPEKKPDTKS